MEYLISSEAATSIALAIYLIGLINKQGTFKSSNYLSLCGLLSIVWALADALSYVPYSTTWPVPLLFVLNYLSFTMACVVIISYLQYCKVFLDERYSINHLLFHIPMGLIAVAFVYESIEIFRGKIFVITDGYFFQVGSLPFICEIIIFAVMIYLFLIPFHKFSGLGFRKSMILGIMGLFPLLTYALSYHYANYDFTPVATNISLTLVCILLQNELFDEQFRKKIDEISTLNQKLDKEKKRDEFLISTIAEAIHGGFKISRNDENFSLVYVSEQLAAMLGFTVDEFMEASGGNMKGIVDLSDISGEIDKARNQIAEGKMYTMNYKIRCKDGSWKYVEDRGRLVEAADGTKEFWCVISDKDELNALAASREKAEAENDAKSVFLFNMSHDIRTPMNAIIGFRDLLEKNQDDPEKRADYLMKIQNASSILLSIINNVLEMARIERGNLEIGEIVWNIELFRDNIESVFSEMMEQKNIDFKTDINVEHYYIYCDNVKLREIFINLISNAYKFTNEGGRISFHIEEIPCEKEGFARYKTTVEDNGIGMNEEYLPHIFERFSRERNSTDTKAEGTGLGLAIVKNLVELMGGTIEVRSHEGEGTVFEVVTEHRIADGNGLVSVSSDDDDYDIFKGKRVLVVEDNDLNAEIAIELLTEKGFIVERAENGLICVKKINLHEADYFSVILMDIQMPHMNGYEATRIIRAMKDKKKAGIPIIAMTANVFEEDKREAKMSGMNGHLSKPIDPKVMFKELADTLKNS